MEKLFKPFILFSAFFLLTACGNDQENYMGESPATPEEMEETGDAEDSGNDSSDSEATLRVMENDSLGEYLADSEGMTLYFFTNDVPETSNCTDDCLVNWPAFSASDIEAPEGYEEDDFDTITREDNGEEQVTFKGYPLYYFISDSAEGDVNGQGLNDAWYIVNNSTEFPE